eukprot:SAG31_NODE_6681_length_1926_cov_1.362343_2_plen_102_part_00
MPVAVEKPAGAGTEASPSAPSPGSASDATAATSGEPKVRAKRRMWSPAEEAALQRGVREHGEGRYHLPTCVLPLCAGSVVDCLRRAAAHRQCSFPGPTVQR